MKKTIAVLAVVASGFASAVSAGSPTPALADPDVTDATPVVLGGTALTTGAVAGTLLALAAIAAVAGGSSGTAATTTTTTN